MRISQLAERSGVPATTLRFYETAGLLPAERTPAGYRLYGQDAVDRLAFIGGRPSTWACRWRRSPNCSGCGRRGPARR
ncbi:MerR family DNA-binding transcriptional regulator [Streptomyces brevispora]|uniref:MerR family DNA-binding transcriptional regulator n=1 Tax=Streptomyces brevispora TaxID=887462 RepID=UPI001FCC4317|nr:MerR family DNA-binding transcriptional regulator [Streptomyces brevispora]